MQGRILPHVDTPTQAAVCLVLLIKFDIPCPRGEDTEDTPLAKSLVRGAGNIDALEN